MLACRPVLGETAESGITRQNQPPITFSRDNASRDSYRGSVFWMLSLPQLQRPTLPISSRDDCVTVYGLEPDTCHLPRRRNRPSHVGIPVVSPLPAKVPYRSYLLTPNLDQATPRVEQRQLDRGWESNPNSLRRLKSPRSQAWELLTS